jgi:hypothetical protein
LAVIRISKAAYPLCLDYLALKRKGLAGNSKDIRREKECGELERERKAKKILLLLLLSFLLLLMVGGKREKREAERERAEKNFLGLIRKRSYFHLSSHPVAMHTQTRHWSAQLCFFS